MIRSVDFEVIDHGWERFLRELKSAHISYTKVGLPGEGKTTGRQEMSELIHTAVINEFGAEKANIPERPFMRDTFDKNEEKIIELQAKGWDDVVTGRKTTRQALRVIGEETEAMIKDILLEANFEPNAEITIRKKGNDIPLYETGQLRDSIQHVEIING
jgi:hypothetical protein